jgi:hypothetical protein
MKEMEREYQDWWNFNMMDDYCWTLHLENPKNSHERRNKTCSFDGKRKIRYKDIEYNLTCKYGIIIFCN